MVVRDEVDLVEAHLRFHLAAGVDAVLVTDHASRDGTREILERHARDGPVRLFTGEGEYNRQGEWMTRMVRIAATELGADWVLCSDGDEFWWPSGGSLKDVLSGVPAGYGLLHVLSQSFVALPDDGEPFAERMTVRLSPPAPISDPATPYRPVAKIAHRASRGAVVSNGNHEVRGVPGRVLRGWVPLEILHFPLRSSEQVARKYRKTWEGWAVNPRADLARAKSLVDEARPEGMYSRIVVDDAVLERGLAAGSLVRDTRLRDALRAIGGDSRPGGASWRRIVNSRHPLETAVLVEAEVVRLQRQVELLRTRAERLSSTAAGDRRSIGLRRP
jgi:Glycosyl transferase family 2